MTHEPEREFTDWVEDYLIGLFGSDRVDDSKYLDDARDDGGIFPDYWIDLDVVILAVEVENDAGSIRNGVAQALEYASTDPRAVPVVITPPDHVDETQVSNLRDICPIIELDVGGDR